MSTQSNATNKFNRILLTGSNGGLGRIIKEKIGDWAINPRLTDISDIHGNTADNTKDNGDTHEFIKCDLSNREGMLELLRGVDVVLHFGGISVESRWDDILSANIVGMKNLYESAHKNGVKRIVFASSNHTIGFHRTTELLDSDSPTRPDGFYGLSKVFGEQIARFYFDRFGIETVCIRIGSAFPHPTTRRMMSTFMHYEDLIELLRCCIFAPKVGYTIVYGVSNNDPLWWDNKKASHLGFRPKHSSSEFKDLFPDTSEYPSVNDLSTSYQGGGFVTTGPFYD